MFSIRIRMSIDYLAFVEKYKLVPKNLRFKFLDFLSHFRHSVSQNDEYGLVDDLITALMSYERTYHDCENYLELSWAIYDEVFPGSHMVYSDVAESIMRQMRWYVKPIRVEDVVRFRHKIVMRDIEERVAYRPGNPGYESAMASFMSSCQKYSIVV